MKHSYLSFFMIALVALTLVMPSCKNSVKFSATVTAGDDDSTQVDTLWNDSIQHEFFETLFGASRQDVIDNFTKHGFVLLDDMSDDDMLIFGHKGAETYPFGGMQWENLTVYLTNGKFSGISFYTPREDKDSAMKDYDAIVKVLSQKYQLTESQPDSTMYKVTRAYSHTPYIVGVGCYSYDSADGKKCYTSSLDYNDLELGNQPSAEL